MLENFKSSIFAERKEHISNIHNSNDVQTCAFKEGCHGRRANGNLAGW